MTDKQAWFLLALGVLNGGVKAEHAARNAATLVRSLTKLENPFCALKGSEIEDILRFPRPLSRFPNQSGRYMRENLQKVQLQYASNPRLIFCKESGALRSVKEIESRLVTLSGIATHKARVLATMSCWLEKSCFEMDGALLSEECPSALNAIGEIAKYFGEFK